MLQLKFPLFITAITMLGVIFIAVAAAAPTDPATYSRGTSESVPLATVEIIVGAALIIGGGLFTVLLKNGWTQGKMAADLEAIRVSLTKSDKLHDDCKSRVEHRLDEHDKSLLDHEHRITTVESKRAIR